jgi:catechol 2,3-dioxygenase-like lactoylglutathione lyase family enzyme
MRLNHVTLIVGDLPRSLHFYRTLGLAPIVHEPPRYARLFSSDGDWSLSIEVTGAPALPARVQLYFECEALDERVAQLRAAGLQFHQLPTDMDYLWREARLSDPDGHELRLYRAGRNRLDPPWKVAPGDLPAGPA